ncbi:Micos complex subunit [Thalictrum thalictroides]|uniref:Micos complex subunit n=1 Tax=Thalictrum thalictroides TaxID=46969 RepID=A0A7J6VUK7_THATH|nr:Micos complex subunit [Thalictrum thalictroides]
MMRRGLLELSRRRSLRQVSEVRTQMPYLLSVRKEFSASSRKHVSQHPSGSVGKPPSQPVGNTPEPAGKPPSSGKSNMLKLVVGGVLITGVAAAAAAYQNNYFNQSGSKNDSTDFDASRKDSKDSGGLGEQTIISNNQEPNVLNDNEIHFEKNGETHLDHPQSSDSSEVGSDSQVQVGVSVKPQEDAVHNTQNELPSSVPGEMASDNQNSHTKVSYEDVPDNKEVGNGFTNVESSIEQNKVVDDTLISEETKSVSKENEMNAPSAHHLTSGDAPEASLVNDAGLQSSLADVYHLGEKNRQSNTISLDEKFDGSIPRSTEKEASVGVSEELKDGYVSKDGNLVLDFLEAIHAAEKRQAELDAHILAEEKRILKLKYEKELKDARARELMYAEEAAMLDKELNKERIKAAATVKALQEKADLTLRNELKHKDDEAEMQLKKVKELAEAELAAAIASEKASQIEKMAEANLHINALCMAFYARSEEARQSHSVHKLALGALALEDALSKGLPIRREINALRIYIEGIDKDSLLDLVLSSIPEETLNHGTKTQLQLNREFDALKRTLRRYSLIPPGGGGILTHTVADIASRLKVKEDDVSGDGIESIINRVESFLAEGKYAEAAEALEGGVSGSQAEKVIGEWVKQARNRAITEQALTLLQSYATSISVT